MDKEYPSISFENRIKEIENDVENLGKLAIKSNRDVVSLLGSYDEKVCKKVVERSNKIDIATIDLERECIKFMATEQPLANDLIFIESTLRVISHIKRIGRLYMKAANSISNIHDVDIPEKIIKELEYMGDYVQIMLNKSISAFLMKDIKKAKELSDDDNKVDELCDSVFNQAVSMIENGELVLYLIDVITLARYFERIADKTVNIGSRTIFVLTLKRPDIETK